MDQYDKMADFLIENNLDDCGFCKAIEMNGNNSCCDDKEWCRKGIAEYLRNKNVLRCND